VARSQKVIGGATMRKEVKKLEKVTDYSLTDSSNKKVKLSDLFEKRQDLILIHKMGKHCPMCTMWADGFNGVLPHLEDHAEFVVVSPDPPAIQKKFAQSRKWKFRMLSAEGTSFIEDMGFGTNQDPCPGVSVFHKKNRTIYRVSKDRFGPGDPYCIVYHFFNLLPGGAGKWHPKFKY
jgi:predicted dithiol-disulfide oxidoreductase (DUF899 family)